MESVNRSGGSAVILAIEEPKNLLVSAVLELIMAKRTKDRDDQKLLKNARKSRYCPRHPRTFTYIFNILFWLAERKVNCETIQNLTYSSRLFRKRHLIF